MVLNTYFFKLDFSLYLNFSNPMSLSYLTGLTIFHRNSQQIVAPYQVRYVFPHGTDRMTALLWWYDEFFEKFPKNSMIM